MREEQEREEELGGGGNVEGACGKGGLDGTKKEELWIFWGKGTLGY